jgi:hypothetical protein
MRNSSKPRRPITATHPGTPTPRPIIAPFPSLEFPLLLTTGTVVAVFEDASPLIVPTVPEDAVPTEEVRVVPVDEVMTRVEVTPFPIAVTVTTVGGVAG